MEIEPVAVIRTDFREKFGIPRESLLAEGCIGRITFEPKYRDPESVRGIEGYSHLWLIFDFSENHRDGWSPTVRPPRLGGNTRVGVFASRSSFRPNSLGLSCVRLLSVENTSDGPVLTVEGADIMDGTPVYDIKPYLRFCDSHDDAVSGFAEATAGYELEVVIPDRLSHMIPDDILIPLRCCLGQDPRPQYHSDGRVYHMRYSDIEVGFTVAGDILTVTDVIHIYE